MRDGLFRVAQQYLLNSDRAGLGRTLATFDWDDRSPEALSLRPLIGELELLTEEVSEEMRDEEELRVAVREAMAQLSGSSPPGEGLNAPLRNGTGVNSGVSSMGIGPD